MKEKPSVDSGTYIKDLSSKTENQVQVILQIEVLFNGSIK